MEDRAPTQPQVVGRLAQTVENHQRVGEIVLMPNAFFRLYSFQRTQFREDQREQAAFIQ